MTYQCPACQRPFAEPGFCPFDGKPLALVIAASAPDKKTVPAPDKTPVPTDKPTLLSAAMQAQSSAETKIVVDSSGTQPGIGGVGAVVAISAAGEGSGAVEQIRNQQKGTAFDSLIGQTLDGRYYVQKKLGEGGMGVVYAVKHAVIERPLAIKVLKREVMRDSATIQRFVQEAKAASRIGHPNIVDVTDFGKTPDGMTYSVMEFVDGTTLSKTIKHAAPMPPARAVRIAAQIARALVAAHGKGIVHRDLKPENVFLVDRDGRPDFVKIVDFGIAKVLPVEGAQAGPRLTRAGSVFGTPEYMAPEQAAGRNDTDGRVDIYALGTILYEMLVGRVPHKGDSMIRTIAMQMLDPIVPPSKVNPDLPIPKELEAIVMKALEKKREDRYATMGDFLSALEQQILRLADAPTFSLPPVPPGADPALAPATPTAQIPPPESPSSPASLPSPRRRANPSTRPLHEPEFVASGTPLSLPIEEDIPVETRSRWPIVVGGLLVLLLGAGGTVLLLSKLRGGDNEAVALTRQDAAVIAEQRDDATLEGPADATVIAEVPLDAGEDPITGRRDGGRRTGIPPKFDRNRDITIEVLTRPGEAEVFIGPNYRGPSGVRITEKMGTKRKIECKTARMKGSIEVVFNGELSAVMCTATRDRFCVPGLKNPYDDCEEEP
jgi:serine/threonine protein kinase